MSKKKFADMMLATSSIKSAADRREKPDLSAPPTTGVGLTTQRIQLQQKVAALQKRIDELEARGGEVVKSLPAEEAIFLRGSKVGSITKDENIFAIKLQSTHLSLDQEHQLRTLLATFFK